MNIIIDLPIKDEIKRKELQQILYKIWLYFLEWNEDWLKKIKEELLLKEIELSKKSGIYTLKSLDELDD